ncbi:Gram-negative porin [Shewanella psychrophila]|uniref:Gram-negative porin n=1 Tax=Shewanella psychrophila TaxID=225848 RepID=A0A1S6HJZ5_9GAMM|nr:porin [Shewanella psychrophila]AQS35846.1 Gram-negative porin [Shewanella psychrophila]
MRKSSLAITIAALIYTPMILAEVNINGFASIVAGSSLDDDKAYYAYDKEINFENDSKIALQFSADLGEGLRATAQVISRGSNDFKPEFEWAYISYDISDNFMLMAGRQRFNLYKYSDYIDVGYAYHWITPPRGVYSLPFNSGEGVGLLYNDLWGETEAGLTYKYITSSISDYQPIGSDATPSPFSAKGHIINLSFITEAFEYGLNIGLIEEYSYELPDLLALGAAISDTGVFPQEIVDDLLPIDDGATLIGAHIKYNADNWFMLAEYTVTELDPSSLSDTTSGYISGGVIFNDLTFHLTYGVDEGTPQMDAYESMLPIYTALPLANQVALAPLLFGTQAALKAQEEDSSYYIVGTRWDFHPSAALKIEYTYYSDDYSDGSDSQLLAMAVDMVF